MPCEWLPYARRCVQAGHAEEGEVVASFCSVPLTPLPAHGKDGIQQPTVHLNLNVSRGLRN
eukprot:2263033-Rhodomonas_salina.1